MKTAKFIFLSRGASAFTLIEMIGVMAIMAILATITVPNVLRAIDRAAIVAEGQTLHNLGEQSKLYLKTRRAPPGLTTPVQAWNVDLGAFADMSPTDILTNKRQMTRSYVYEPVATPARLLIISSMRTGLNLPTATNLNTIARFDHVWTTADGQIPPTGTDAWAGWSAWRLPATANGGDYLLIERVNFSAIYGTELQTFAFSLKNTTPIAATPPAVSVAATEASYEVVLAIGGPQGRVTVSAQGGPFPTTQSLPALRPKDRINFYRVNATTPASPESSYVVSNTGKSFYFNGTSWIPQ